MLLDPADPRVELADQEAVADHRGMIGCHVLPQRSDLIGQVVHAMAQCSEILLQIPLTGQHIAQQRHDLSQIRTVSTAHARLPPLHAQRVMLRRLGEQAANRGDHAANLTMADVAGPAQCARNRLRRTGVGNNSVIEAVAALFYRAVGMSRCRSILLTLASSSVMRMP